MSGKSLPEDGGMFPSWFAAQMAKQPDPQLSERIRVMHRMYGVREGCICKHCKHLYFKQFAKRFYKCEVFGRDTNGLGTDWRVSWPACNRYEERST